MFKDKHIIVGVCGGIAAFKAAGLVSRLRQEGADVHVIMTEHATKLVTPLTFGELSGNEVSVDLFSNVTKWDVQHIALARMADLFIVAPATANMLGKVAGGIADDMLSTTITATKAPVIFVPSMNTNMYENPIVQANMKKLADFGYHFVEPDSGHLACNTEGKGRFPEIEKILAVAEKCLCGRHLLKGKKVIISAGGTREDIDPVRYISNRSSGRMGYALAKAAAMEDADVTLVSCTTALPEPEGVTVKYVRNARELDKAMNEYFDDCDVAIMSAAVSDYRPKNQSDKKIKKEGNEQLVIELDLNPDILFGLGQKKKKQFLVGFAAETNDLMKYATKKLKKKNLDMLVANNVAQPGAGFNVNTNIASLLYRDGTVEEFPIMSKDELGMLIVEKLLNG